jgi:hypothetical protein
MKPYWDERCSIPDVEDPHAALRVAAWSATTHPDTAEELSSPEFLPPSLGPAISALG